MYRTPTTRLTATHPDTERLLEEIETLELRLHRMGGDGDCAYERAMSTLYRRIVEQNRQQLRRLRP